MKQIFSIILFVIVFCNHLSAQFYTVGYSARDNKAIIRQTLVDRDAEAKKVKERIEKGPADSVRLAKSDSVTDGSIFKQIRMKTGDKFRRVRKMFRKDTKVVSHSTQPDLTISNLVAEIYRNNIRHPKIVLAQAILETGWFSSSVCRNKNNLFGLTDPRTGKYYEFDDWRDSVKAYQTKVQYRYKEGNYLLWLKKIGYAEDPRYINSLARIIEQYLI